MILHEGDLRCDALGADNAHAGTEDRIIPQDDDRTEGALHLHAQPIRLVLVTGVSGAGKNSALAALADFGFANLDNPPLSMVPAILDEFGASTSGPRVAIGLDERSNGFSTERLANTVRALRARDDVEMTVLFLDCSDEILLRRFNETRRRHPLADGESVEAALAVERRMLAPIKEEADIALDTSDLSLTALRQELQNRFTQSQANALSVSLVSFGFKRGAPREADILFDVRFLANPYWEPELREGTGLDEDVAAFVAASPGFDELFGDFAALVSRALPYYRAEGKSYLTIAIGCTGGRHRSVASVERLAATLQASGISPSIRHRDLPAGSGGRGS